MATDFEIHGKADLDGSGVNSGLSAMTVAAGQLISDFVQKAISGLQQVVNAGIDFNAQMEQYQVAFTTLLGSAEQAIDALDAIKADAAETPFDTATLVRANQFLISTGISAEESRKAINALGDAVSATGGGTDELARMAQNLQQVKNAGAATAMDIRQFAMAGIDIDGILADYTGQSTEQVQDMAVTYYDLVGALEAAASEGGRYYGAMDAQSQTINGRISTLKDNATLLIGALTEGLTEQFGDTIENAITWIGQLTDAFETGGMEGMLQAGASMVSALASQCVAALPELLASATDWGVQLLTRLADGAEEGIPQLLAKALPMLEQFTANLRENAGRLVDAGIHLLQSLMTGLMNALPELLAYVPQIVINLAGLINDNGPKLLSAGLGLIAQLIVGILSAIPDLLAAMPKIVEAIFSVIQAFNWLALGKNIITALKNGITAMAGAVRGAANGIFTTIRNALTSLPGSLLQIAKNAVSSIVSAFRGQNWGSIGSSIISGIVNGIGAAIGGLVSAAANAAASALKAAKSALGIKSPSKRFRDEVGAQIPAGTAEGVNEHAEEAVDAARRNAEQMVAAAQSAVFENQIQTGDQITQTGITAQTTLQASWRGESVTILQVDGREVARTTAPYMDEQLDW